MLNSLLGRLMTFSTLTLLVLMLGVGLLLEHSFYLSQLNAMQERLKLHSYSILSVAEYQQQQLFLPRYLQERRFNTAESGLYALVVRDDFQVAWSSRSATNLPVAANTWAPQGQWLYSSVQRGGRQYLLARFGVSWSESGRPGPVYNVLLMEDTAELQQQVGDYRKTLALLLVTLIFIILLLLYLVLRWGLRPLNQVAEDLKRLQQGQQAALGDQYPRELQPLTSNLNRLVASERHQRERYRNTMADLSHSLKTPLTVMAGIIRELLADSEQPRESYREMQSQIEKMNGTIAYQLRRAVSGSHTLSIQQVEVFPLAASVCDAMDKVYANKNIMIHLDIGKDVIFNGDENDLLEVLGNLIDNACKYGRQTVEVMAHNTPAGLLLEINDDGPGINKQQHQTILQRGQRLDTAEHGQGLGLALVKEILDSYQAELSVKTSALGGACFSVDFCHNDRLNKDEK